MIIFACWQVVYTLGNWGVFAMYYVGTNIAPGSRLSSFYAKTYIRHNNYR